MPFIHGGRWLSAAAADDGFWSLSGSDVLDHIADQLRAEIASLAEYIQRTEERLQVSEWVADLLDPFERIENGLSPGDLRRVVTALHQARYHFEVNGHLSGRIESILDRHGDLIDTPSRHGDAHTNVESMPARDPAYTDLSADDEEIHDAASAPPRGGSAFQAFDFSADEDSFAADELMLPAPSTMEAPRVADAGPLDPASAEPGLFTAPDAIDWGSDSLPDERGQEDTIGRETDVRDGTAGATEPLPSPLPDRPDDSALSGDPGQLFQTQDASEPDLQEMSPRSEGAMSSSPSPHSADLGRDDADELFAATGASPSSGQHKPAAGREPESPDDTRAFEEPEEGIDLFAHKVSIEDVLLRLDITIPAQDKTKLQNLLRNKIGDRVIAALRINRAFERQFILIPRLTRFVHEGQLYPCTVKNLARTFIALFGDIRDLMRYRDERFLDAEVPQQGWALITAEAPRESLNKTFMEQTQYLRYLSASLGISSHLVRRRTLVEAVYDCVVGRMVLGNALQLHTLDWTSSSVGRSDYVGIYVADSGIRLRDLPRTTHNRALGTVPNW